MFTEEERAKFKQRFAMWKAGEKVYDAGKRVERTDATTVLRQEPIQPIKRNFVAEAQRKRATEVIGPDVRSSYQRQQSQTAKQHVNQQYKKAKDDARRAEGLELMMKMVSPSTYVEAVTGLDLGTVGRLATDAIAFGVPGLIKRGMSSIVKGAANYRYPFSRPTITKTILDNGKIRLSLPSHADTKPRLVVLEPAGNNKYYVHMRMWDDIENKIPASNVTNLEKLQLFDALYNELPDGAEILFPKSGAGNYGTRGTVAGLQRLSRDPRFIPGTKGTLQYLDKDGKTVRTYKGTSFIKSPKITKTNAASITPEQWTAAQDAAIARGDMAEAQRLRDLHFKVSAPNTKIVDGVGNPQLVIHKTPNDFTVFDNNRSVGKLNWAASPNAFEGENAVFATGAGTNPKEMRLYINMKNPHYPTIDEGMEPAFINEGEDGILGIIDKDATDFYKSASDAGEGFLMSLGVDNPYALKLANAVTYDNKGIRIPLGKRDNFKIKDVRYGLLPFLGIGAGYGLYNQQ